MHDKQIRLLSTAALSESILQQAYERHVEIDVIPFTKIERLLGNEVRKFITLIKSQPATIVFTSKNAVEAVVEMLGNFQPKQWKIYCTCGATLDLIKKQLPHCSIAYAADNAAALARHIVSGKVKEVTFFCGNKRREELPAILEQQKIKMNGLIVYETIETPFKTDTSYDGILFFSPSAVSSFFSDNKASPETILFAIGKTTADAIEHFSPKNSIEVCQFPSKKDLVIKAIEYFQQNKR